MGDTGNSSTETVGQSELEVFVKSCENNPIINRLKNHGIAYSIINDQPVTLDNNDILINPTYTREIVALIIETLENRYNETYSVSKEQLAELRNYLSKRRIIN